MEDALYYSKLTELMTLPDNYQSIQLIMNKYQKSFNFKFEFVSRNQGLKYINEINSSKSLKGKIAAKIIKTTKEEVIVPIPNCINKCISSSTFPV